MVTHGRGPLKFDPFMSISNPTLMGPRPRNQTFEHVVLFGHPEFGSRSGYIFRCTREGGDYKPHAIARIVLDENKRGQSSEIESSLSPDKSKGEYVYRMPERGFPLPGLPDSPRYHVVKPVSETEAKLADSIEKMRDARVYPKNSKVRE
jgi:hypothetical protein